MLLIIGALRGPALLRLRRVQHQLNPIWHVVCRSFHRMTVDGVVQLVFAAGNELLGEQAHTGIAVKMNRSRAVLVSGLQTVGAHQGFVFFRVFVGKANGGGRYPTSVAPPNLHLYRSLRETLDAEIHSFNLLALPTSNTRASAARGVDG